MTVYAGVPERFKTEGIFVHGRDRVVVGDEVEAIRNVLGVIQRGARLKICDLIVEPNVGRRGFVKKLLFEEVDGEFNPQRFRKV
jgi:hypothetical protein